MVQKLVMPLDTFKEREIEIVGLMAEGFTNREIAEQLYITKETVRWYNKQIYSKLGTSRRTEAIALAREMGLIGDKEPAPSSPIVPLKLPATTGPFIGRNDEIAELLSLLEQPTIRLVSIVAAGGMGKSRLALELGHLVKGQLAHGVAFVDLAPVNSPDAIATTAVASLGLSVSGRQSPRDVLFNYCRGKELLLIFDNFEHVLEGAPLLADLLEAASNIKVVVTTRERLNLRVESLFTLQPVSESGATLFREVAHMMHPNFAGSDEDESEIERIVTVVGGLPLALVLAATWLDTLSVSEIADEIESNLEFLSSEMQDMPQRQQSIHAVIDPTWKRLNEQERRAFMWASVFRGGFTRKLLRQVTGASLRTVQSLLRRSLVEHGQNGRHTLHPLVRQYAYEKLSANGQADEARQSHLNASVEYAETHAARWRGEQYLDTLAALDAEQDNFRAALDWSLTGQDVSSGVVLIKALYHFWVDRSQISEAAHYISLALSLREDVPELYGYMSYIEGRRGRWDSAEKHSRKLITLAEASDSRLMLAKGYIQLASVLNSSVPYDVAETLLKNALELATAANAPKTIARCYLAQGILLSQSGAPPSAYAAVFQKSLDLMEELEDLQGISRAAYNLAIAHFRLGNIELVKELCNRSLSLKRKIGDTAGVARRLMALAYWDIIYEEFERASRYLSESRAICEELGELGRLQFTLYVQGILFMVKGEYANSQAALEQMLTIAKGQRIQSDIANSYSCLAQVFLLQGNVEAASQYILQALEADRAVEKTNWPVATAYANYLWYRRDFAACVPLVAALSIEVENDVGSDDLLEHIYFLRPLVHRARTKVGEQAWLAALDAVGGKTVKQHLLEAEVEPN